MRKKFLVAGCLVGLLMIGSSAVKSQQKIVILPFGNFDNWVVREINESAVIGGNTRYIYEIAKGDTLRDNTPYKNMAGSPWATSNVLAKVSGVIKSSATVFPEKRGDGQCARLDTRLEDVKVLGIINISVLASGSIFLGQMDEPIKDTKNPNSKLMMGIPFTRRPTAMVMDYKLKASPDNTRIKATGFSSRKEIPGRDYASVIVLLQKRWEDENGDVYAKRVGTAVERLGDNTPEWVNGYQIPILYGNITTLPAFKPYMNLLPPENSYYCKNSNGKIVPVVETGWGDTGDEPTHIILMISSSYDSAYQGTIGNSIMVDNVGLVY